MNDPPKRRDGADKAAVSQSSAGSPAGRGAAGAATKPAPRAAGARVSLTIGDLAREFDISTRAIRFYEARGLMAPHRHGANRIFGRSDQQRLALILRAKNLGLSLEEIAAHLALHDAGEATSAELPKLRLSADRQIANLTAKRNDLQETLKDLRRIRLAIEERQTGRKARGRT